MYLKITNAEENHFGLQYHDGLNIDPIQFEREGSCVPGGIYFTTLEYICGFISMGIYVREVTIPEDAEMVQDPGGNKWRASKVILGQRKEIWNIDTWKWLIYNGVNINFALAWASYKGQLEIVKYLIENGADIHHNNDGALRNSSDNGDLEIVKYLVEHGAYIKGETLRLASSHGHFEVVKYLVEHGADMHADGDNAFRWACRSGNLKIVKYLVQAGADIHSYCDEALKLAYYYERLDVINFLERLSVPE